MKMCLLNLFAALVLSSCTTASPVAQIEKGEKSISTIDSLLRVPLNDGKAGFDKVSAYLQTAFDLEMDDKKADAISNDKIVRMDDGYVLEYAAVDTERNSISVNLRDQPCLSVKDTEEIMNTSAGAYSEHHEMYSPYANRNGIHVNATAFGPEFKCVTGITIRVLTVSLPNTPTR